MFVSIWKISMKHKNDWEGANKNKNIVLGECNNFFAIFKNLFSIYFNNVL